MSLRAQLLTPRRERVEIPGLDGDLFARVLTTAEVLALSEGETHQGYALIAASLQDADGARIFDTAEQVGDVPADTFRRLLEHVNRVNALTVDDDAGNA